MHRYETQKGLAHEGAPPTSSNKATKGGVSEGMGTLLAPCYSINGDEYLRVSVYVHRLPTSVVVVEKIRNERAFSRFLLLLLLFFFYLVCVR